jgi:hypothetical protein
MPARFYATFERHQMGDFKPYVYKSTDLGPDVTNIARGTFRRTRRSIAFVQDTKDADLLFAGTEFGLFFTHDGGRKWLKLSGGMPDPVHPRRRDPGARGRPRRRDVRPRLLHPRRPGPDSAR